MNHGTVLIKAPSLVTSGLTQPSLKQMNQLLMRPGGDISHVLQDRKHHDLVVTLLVIDSGVCLQPPPPPPSAGREKQLDLRVNEEALGSWSQGPPCLSRRWYRAVNQRSTQANASGTRAPPPRPPTIINGR